MTEAEFRARIPAMASKPPSPEAVNRWLAEFEERFNTSRFGSYLPAVTAYWVAHQLALEAGMGTNMASAGEATKAPVGVRTEMMTNPYLRTIYGQQFLEAVEASGAGMGPVAV